MNNFRTENINIKGNEYYNNDFKLYLDECMCLYNTSNKCDENCIKKTFKLTDLDGIEPGTYTLFVDYFDNADAAEWKNVDRQVFVLEDT